MKKCLLLPAFTAMAVLPLSAQQAAPSAATPAPAATPSLRATPAAGAIPTSGKASAVPSISLGAADTVLKLTQGAVPAGLLSPGESPAITEAELLDQIDALGRGEPITRLPRSVPGAGGDKKDSGNGTTEITAKEGNFDQKGHVAIFLKDVYVENPDFTVNCDKLTAYLHHDEKEDAAAAGGKPGTPAAGAKPAAGKPASTPKPVAAAKPAATPASNSSKAPKVSEATSGNATLEERVAGVGGPPKPKSASGGGGLEKAIAEGNVLINQDKIDPDGSISHNVGHSKKAIYETSTGDIYLYGKPTVEQGANTCIALAEETYMVLNRAGQMKVYGLHKSIIRDSGSSSDSKPANAR